MLKVYYARCIEKDSFSEKLEQDKLHSDRIKKIQKLSNIDEKCRSLSAGLLVSYALEKENISIKDIKIEYKENGKPYLKDCKLYYNISHTKKYVAVVVSDREVGIDVETIRERWIKRYQQLENLANKILSNKEKIIFDLKDTIDDKAAYFTEIWTKKESYVKTTGKGITSELSKIDTSEMDCFFTDRIDYRTFLSICCFENVNILEKINKKEIKL